MEGNAPSRKSEHFSMVVQTVLVKPTTDMNHEPPAITSTSTARRSLYFLFFVFS